MKCQDEPERPLIFLEYRKSSASEDYIKEILEYLQNTEMFDVFADVNEKVSIFKPKLKIVDKAEIEYFS